MNFKIKSAVQATQAQPATGVGHDGDQYESIIMGEDLSALTSLDETEAGQPSASTESLKDGKPAPEDNAVQEGHNENCPPPCVSRVNDPNGGARIHIVLGTPERTKWLSVVIGLIDSASENDKIDITIVDSCVGSDTYSCRSLLSSIDRCKAHVITHAGALTSLGDIALWLSGDELRYSKKMSATFARQQLTGFYGDIRDFVGKSDDAALSFREYSNYISSRGLFTKAELSQMFETRGILALWGKELEARVANLKEVADE